MSTLNFRCDCPAGNPAEALIVVNLRNFSEFALAIPEDISLIHLPLKVAVVNDEAIEINTIGNLFDLLGEGNVNFIITRDTSEGVWRSYLGNQNRGGPADRTITDDLGTITVMNNPVTFRLKGAAWGIDGVSTINLGSGFNLMGVALQDARLKKVSDLLSLDGIKDNVSSIIVSDGGAFKVVAQPGDDGDIEITGGQSFVVAASKESVAEVIGEPWDNVSGGVVTAPSVALVGHKIDRQTPVMAIHGAVIDEVTGETKDGFPCHRQESVDRCFAGHPPRRRYR